jgi:hypothetical protein
MSIDELTRIALPYARRALIEARSEVIEAVTPAGWVLLWPAWAVLIGPLLPLLVRIGLELMIALSAPKLTPVFEVANALLVYVAETYVPAESKAFLAELTTLLRTPRSALMGPVQIALALRASDQGDT